MYINLVVFFKKQQNDAAVLEKKLVLFWKYLSLQLLII